MKRFLPVLVLGAAGMIACGPPAGDGLGPEHAGVAGGAMAASAQGSVAFAAFDPAIQPSDDKVTNGSRIARPLSQFEGLVDLGAPSAQGAGGGACHTISGDPTDDDMDDIPVDITATFDCANTVGQTDFTFTGAQYYRDTQPTVASALNFSAGQDAITLLATYPAGNASLAESWDVTASAIGLDLGLDTSASIDGQSTRNLVEGGTKQHTFSVTHDFDASLVLLSGDATINGSWGIDVNAVSQGDVTVNTVPTVHVDIACPTFIDSGVIEGTYTGRSGNTDVLRVTWTACGQHTVELNGAPIEPEGPVAGGQADNS